MSRTLPLQVAALIAATPASSAELSGTATVQAESRVRSILPGDVSTGATADFQLLPTLSARVTTVRWLIELGYRPNLLLRDVPGGGPVLPLHQGAATVQWQRDATTVRLSSEGALGSLYLGPLLTNELPAGQVASSRTVGLVDYQRLATSFSLSGRIGNRINLRGEATYDVSGSPNNLNLPMQWGPGATLQVGWLGTRVDQLTSTVSFRHATFKTGHVQTLGQVTQAWTRNLTRPLALELSGGAALVQQHAPEAASVAAFSAFDVLPVAAAKLTATFPARESKVELRARAGVAPFADRFTATVYERVEGTVGGAWSWRRDLTLGSSLAVARSFPRASLFTPPDFLVALEGTAAWAAKPWLLLGATLRAARVEVLVPGAAPMNQWLASVSITFHDQEHTSW